MISKMIENDLLSELNFDNMPNVKANIGEQYWEQSKGFDPENKYSVPYCWGTVGILYNKTMVDEPVDSWSILWDEKYADSISDAGLRTRCIYGCTQIKRQFHEYP